MRFPRNPYTVTNVMDVWECDLMDMQSLSKYNDKYKYLLSVILSRIPTYRTAAVKDGYSREFCISFDTRKYSKPLRRRPVWVRTYRSKEFLNRTLQAMLRKESIQFQICRDPNVKCAIVEGSHLTIRAKLQIHDVQKHVQIRLTAAIS